MPIVLLLLLVSPFALYLSVTQGEWFRERRRRGDRAIGIAVGLLTVIVVSGLMLARPRIGVPIGWALFMMTLPFTLTPLMLAVTVVMIAVRQSRKSKEAGSHESKESKESRN